MHCGISRFPVTQITICVGYSPNQVKALVKKTEVPKKQGLQMASCSGLGVQLTGPPCRFWICPALTISVSSQFP